MTDIILLDIMMPKLDGFSMVELIRKEDQSTPIIFLSARVDTEDVVKGFEIGAFDYVKKPFDIKELIARIKHLTRDVVTNQTIFQIGSIRFDS